MSACTLFSTVRCLSLLCNQKLSTEQLLASTFALLADLEWKLIYVGSPESEKYDQVLLDLWRLVAIALSSRRVLSTVLLSQLLSDFLLYSATGCRLTHQIQHNCLKMTLSELLSCFSHAHTINR